MMWSITQKQVTTSCLVFHMTIPVFLKKHLVSLRITEHLAFDIIISLDNVINHNACIEHDPINVHVTSNYPKGLLAIQNTTNVY